MTHSWFYTDSTQSHSRFYTESFIVLHRFYTESFIVLHRFYTESFIVLHRFIYIVLHRFYTAIHGSTQSHSNSTCSSLDWLISSVSSILIFSIHGLNIPQILAKIFFWKHECTPCNVRLHGSIVIYILNRSFILLAIQFPSTLKLEHEKNNEIV